MLRTITLRKAIVIAAAALVLASPLAQAMKLKKQNLTDLISQSQSIVAGTVKSVTDGIAPNGMPYTEVTIEIGQSAKGALRADSEYTFRQFGLLEPRRMPNGKTLLAVTPEGFPTWHEGEFAVAFFYKPASKTGFQTTAGMAQGKLTQVNGKLVNEFNNAGLFEGVDIAPGTLSAAEQNLLTTPGAVDAATFMSLVGRAVEERWIETGVMQ